MTHRRLLDILDQTGFYAAYNRFDLAGAAVIFAATGDNQPNQTQQCHLAHASFPIDLVSYLTFQIDLTI